MVSRFFQTVSVIALLCIVPLQVSAAAQVPVAEATIDQLDEAMEGLVEGTEPGIAVGIVKNGETVFEDYTGFANLEHEVPNGPKTRFNIASNAKQYTALMVLDLAEQGRIDLDQDFRQYLPDAMPSIDQQITVRQLIAHQSGVRDIYDLWALTGVTWYQRPFDSDDALVLLDRQTDLNFEPGTDHLYSNSNYILLAALVSEITGQPFHEYAEAFFDKIGMPDTMVKRRYGVIVPHMARAYGEWSGWLEDPAIANLHGDGFLFTTLQDQLAWEKQLQGGQSAFPADLLSESQQPIHGTQTTGYGYGLELGQYKGLNYVYHVGSTGGYNAYLMRFPAQQLSIIVMGNTTQIGVVGMGNMLADILLGDDFTAETSYPAGPDSIGPKPETSSVLGRYELDSGTIVTISETDGELFREIEGRDPVRLIHEQGNVYAYETLPDLKLVFEEVESETQGFALYLETQAPQIAVPLEDAPATESYLTSIEGRFVNPETDTIIIIEHQEGDRYSLTKNGRTRDAVLLAKDRLSMNSYRIEAVRSAENGGMVSGLMVDNNRIRNVRFERVQ